jgi:hypothetical protein
VLQSIFISLLFFRVLNLDSFSLQLIYFYQFINMKHSMSDFLSLLPQFLDRILILRRVVILLLFVITNPLRHPTS